MPQDLVTANSPAALSSYFDWAAFIKASIAMAAFIVVAAFMGFLRTANSFTTAALAFVVRQNYCSFAVRPCSACSSIVAVRRRPSSCLAAGNHPNYGIIDSLNQATDCNSAEVAQPCCLRPGHLTVDCASSPWTALASCFSDQTFAAIARINHC